MLKIPNMGSGESTPIVPPSRIREYRHGKDTYYIVESKYPDHPSVMLNAHRQLVGSFNWAWATEAKKQEYHQFLKELIFVGYVPESEEWSRY